MNALRIILAVSLLAVPALRAQIIADSTTNTLSNVTNFFTGDVTVGTNGSFTLLVLSDNTLLTNSANVIIGRNTTAKSNEVRLVSSSARWLMGGLFALPTVYLGSNGAFNRLVVSNGATMRAFFGYVGFQVSASNNLARVTGPGSVWSIAGLTLGGSGAGNQVIVSDGGVLGCASSTIGVASSNNLAVVTGAGSTWTNENNLTVGLFGAGNQLWVSEGGAVHNARGSLGSDMTGGNNVALITGSGSVWSNRGDLLVGELSAGNRLVVSNGGTVVASNLFVGLNASSTNNRVVVDGGTLRVTNVAGNGILDVRRGTNVFNAGWIEADVMRLTNSPASVLEFNGGTLSVKSSRVTVGNPLRIGNSVSPATWLLAGNGTHDFSGTLGLLVSSNATFTGNGTLMGQLLVQNGGTVAPGASIGKMIFSNSPSLLGTVVMEIFKSDAVLTNDQVQVSGPLPYGGVLTVTHIGPGALAVGDRFQLFSASSYTGAFSVTNLPPPGFLLGWTNKLLVDGSIEVVGPAANVYVTARPSPAGTGPNPDGTYFEFMLLGDTSAESAAVGAPERTGSRAYLSSTTLTDTNAGFAVVPNLPVPGAVYQLDYTFSSSALNINTDAVLSVSCTNATLSVTNTDKFQAQYGTPPFGAPASWTTIGYLTNHPHVSTPRIEFRYESGFINGGPINKRLDVDCFRFTMKVPRPQVSTAALSGTNLVISGFDGVPNGSYTVMTSTNVALPITDWSPLVTNSFDGSGDFLVTNAVSPTAPQRFYLLRVP